VGVYPEFFYLHFIEFHFPSPKKGSFKLFGTFRSYTDVTNSLGSPFFV